MSCILFFSLEEFYPFPDQVVLQKKQFSFYVERKTFSTFFSCMLSQWIALWIESRKTMFKAQGPVY